MAEYLKESKLVSAIEELNIVMVLENFLMEKPACANQSWNKYILGQNQGQPHKKIHHY